MLVNIYEKIFAFSPLARRLRAKYWYRYVAKVINDSPVIFMNYGYAHPGGKLPQIALQKADEVNRGFIQLYHHVAGQIDLNGLDVLEIGCGRGGGASYVARYLGPKSMVAVDLNPVGIDFCKKNYSVQGLSFVEGDAESLDLADNSFDAVINVESSHCYGNMEKFLSEVVRVLRPGGYFLFTDFRVEDAITLLEIQLSRSGMDRLKDEVITSEILRATEQDSETRLGFVMRYTPKFLRPLGRNFAGVKGSLTHLRFSSGELVYKSYTFRKPERQ